MFVFTGCRPTWSCKLHPIFSKNLQIELHLFYFYTAFYITPKQNQQQTTHPHWHCPLQRVVWEAVPFGFPQLGISLTTTWESSRGVRHTWCLTWKTDDNLEMKLAHTKKHDDKVECQESNLFTSKCSWDLWVCKGMLFLSPSFSLHTWHPKIQVTITNDREWKP